MFEFDVMWGAMLFNLLRIVPLFLMTYFGFQVGKIIFRGDGEINAKDRKSLKRYLTATVIVIVAMTVLSSGAGRPKLTLNPMENRARIHYENNTEPVVIITPPPRVEYLDGFRSIGD